VILGNPELIDEVFYLLLGAHGSIYLSQFVRFYIIMIWRVAWYIPLLRSSDRAEWLHDQLPHRQSESRFSRKYYGQLIILHPAKNLID
jgi:hypothetical protein